MRDYVEFSDLKGKVLAEITVNEYNDEIIFKTTEGDEYIMYHIQDCCESVVIDDINGDLQNLIGKEILEASERVSYDESTDEYVDDSNTWTFYHLATIDETVVIKWWGSSNGYYSESVDFCKLN